MSPLATIAQNLTHHDRILALENELDTLREAFARLESKFQRQRDRLDLVLGSEPDAEVVAAQTERAYTR